MWAVVIESDDIIKLYDVVIQIDLVSVTKILAKMGFVIKYPKTEFIALLLSHDQSQSKFIQLILC